MTSRDRQREREAHAAVVPVRYPLVWDVAWEPNSLYVRADAPWSATAGTVRCADVQTCDPIGPSPPPWPKTQEILNSRVANRSATYICKFDPSVTLKM